MRQLYKEKLNGMLKEASNKDVYDKNIDVIDQNGKLHKNVNKTADAGIDSWYHLTDSDIKKINNLRKGQKFVHTGLGPKKDLKVTFIMQESLKEAVDIKQYGSYVVADLKKYVQSFSLVKDLNAYKRHLKSLKDDADFRLKEIEDAEKRNKKESLKEADMEGKWIGYKGNILNPKDVKVFATARAAKIWYNKTKSMPGNYGISAVNSLYPNEKKKLGLESLSRLDKHEIKESLDSRMDKAHKNLKEEDAWIVVDFNTGKEKTQPLKKSTAKIAKLDLEKRDKNGKYKLVNLVTKKKESYKNRLDVLQEAVKQNFSEPEMKSLLAKLKSNVKAPYVNGQVSTLGGTPSTMLSVSKDKKSDWQGGYLENSQYGKFMLDYDGTIEMISGSLRPYMRKTRFKTIDEAVAKINKYIASVK